ncbi:peroxisomal membrane protein 11-4 [Physcomitrium patens]|uniref:Peroxisomal biogenesis factor 11 n=1 Tax=Physcomitrium patens TaxID=3218 RepID=A0A2K1IBS4_PHYPA|nr:peroxisomal membrane protein 11-4-like [Physcomitrium patens]PNR26731.1 hypothetical protein PHYPA_030212 [Physcomitrium patens]|eukprot:XP_024366729.1 peroxisomal membrane protein 11-4-like [Physcomitrella patens]
MGEPKDTLDKLVVFLAKRDGIDKVVKTLQYVGKLAHYGLERKNPVLAARYKNLEVAAGLSRKAFRTGRSLGAFNTLRTASHPDLTIQLLTIFGYGGEMVYWFFDHFTWLSKVGVLDPSVGVRTAYISAFGESVWYIFFITMDVIVIKRGLKTEVELKKQLAKLVKSEDQARAPLMEDSATGEQIKSLKAKLSSIRLQRVMAVSSIIAKTADLFIALAVVDPNPFVSHTITLGLSGLASAWAGWYQLWPASK